MKSSIFQIIIKNIAGLSSLGVPMPWHPQILAYQVTLSQPRVADYPHQIILAPLDFKTFRRPCKYCNDFCPESFEVEYSHYEGLVNHFQKFVVVA